MSDKTVQKVSDEVVIESSNIELVPYGLRFVNEVSREEWATTFQKLQHVNTMYQWYLGDLVAQADWQWKGEMYDMMMEISGLERGTLANLANAARTYPAEVRQQIYESFIKDVHVNMKLSFEHFRITAPIMNKNPERAVDFLIRAGQQGWSVATLREQIARWKNGGTLPEKAERAEKFDEVIPDGWERVKNGTFEGYVPAPVDLDEGDEPEATFLVQVTEEEAERLIDYIKGNSGFLSLVERLRVGLEGV